MFSPKTPFLYLINFLEVKPTIESDPIMTKESGDGGSWVTEFGQITVDTESDFDEVSSDDITITSESSVSTMVSSKPVKAAAGGTSIPVGDRTSARPVSTKLPRSFSRGVRAAQPRVNRGGLYSEVSTPTRVSLDFIILGPCLVPSFFSVRYNRLHLHHHRCVCRFPHPLDRLFEVEDVWPFSTVGVASG